MFGLQEVHRQKPGEGGESSYRKEKQGTFCQHPGTRLQGQPDR